jgi:hypothetical protein
MADLKISALPASTTPLAGTEVLPIVQSSTTKQVSVANLTIGRTQTSNGIVQGTAGTGYNFTANTPAAGMTSQLLNWYEQGTWTPTSVVGTATAVFGTYTRIGRQVTVLGTLTFPVQVDASIATIGGLPFTSDSTASGGVIKYTTLGSTFFLYGNGTSTTISCYATTGSSLSYTAMSGVRVDFAMTYFG